MSLRPIQLGILLLALAAIGGCRGNPDSDRDPAAGHRSVVGRLSLPSGSGSRGVEVLLTVASDEGEPRTVWVLFDDEGRFSHDLQGTLTAVEVTAGARPVVRIDAAELPAADRAGRIDLGVLDLLDRLGRHRMTLRAAGAEPAGVVRIGLWLGPPPVGPLGEPVSLGSAQFPEIALGSELEWLVPHDARDVFFLVERPDGPNRGRAWRSGEQTLFGPFTSAGMPTELVLE